MAANGISTLPTKQARQEAKLALAADRRAETGRSSELDMSLLPTVYVDNDLYDNPNPDGLIPGRPWVIDGGEGGGNFANFTGFVVSTQSPFTGGGNSYHMAGDSTSYLEYAASSDWAPGTGDFTIEWFQYQIYDQPYPRIFQIGSYPSASIGVSIEGGTFYFWSNGSAYAFGDATPYKNTWVHWAVVRLSGIVSVYKNGILFGTPTSIPDDVADNTTPLTIGNELDRSDDAGFGGYLTNFRWVTGLAVYTGNFVVPTSALTAVATANPYGGSNTQAIPAGFTKLLINP